MQDLKKLTDVVKYILTEQENTRNDVFDLYYAVCKHKNPQTETAKFSTVLKSHNEYGIPTFESVTRARRKIVEEFPELKGCDEVEGGRWSSKEEYEQYARGCV